MNLKEQQYIVTLADCGNMTKAAQRLGVSQPALSSYLAGVENTLGYPLFDRTAKRLVPTCLGEVYIEKAKKILALGEEFDLERDRVVHGYRGRLRVSVPLRRSPVLVPSALKIFHSTYPDVELILHEGNQRAMTELLHSDELDLMFCNLTDPHQGLEYVDIYRDPVIFLVQHSNPCCRHGAWREGFRSPWIDLKEFEQDIFLLQHPGQSLSRYADHILSEVDVRPARTMLIRNIETAAQMASEGMGVTFCLESYFRHMNFVQRPQVFSVGTQQHFATFSVGHRRGKHLPEYALGFVDIVKGIMSMEQGRQNNQNHL